MYFNLYFCCAHTNLYLQVFYKIDSAVLKNSLLLFPSLILLLLFLLSLLFLLFFLSLDIPLAYGSCFGEDTVSVPPLEVVVFGHLDTVAVVVVVGGRPLRPVGVGDLLSRVGPHLDNCSFMSSSVCICIRIPSISKYICTQVPSWAESVSPIHQDSTEAREETTIASEESSKVSSFELKRKFWKKIRFLLQTGCQIHKSRFYHHLVSTRNPPKLLHSA